MQEFWFPGLKTSKFLLHFFNFTIYSTLVYQCCEWCYVTSQVFEYSCSDEIESTCLFWIITLCSNLLPSPSSMWMLRHWWITVLVLGQGMYLLWSNWFVLPVYDVCFVFWVVVHFLILMVLRCCWSFKVLKWYNSRIFGLRISIRLST